MCMPIAPYVTFDDIENNIKDDSTILPFTSINPMLSVNDACERLYREKHKAYGLKLHPIIQGISFDCDMAMKILEVVRAFNKPVLFHAGVSHYYLANEKNKQHLECDNILSAKKMIQSFPDIKFIIGHAGCLEMKEWADEMAGLENVFVDVTVQSIKSIRYLVKRYGEDRILFASDWPCINPRVTLDVVTKALSWTQLEKCLYKNTASLIGLN